MREKDKKPPDGYWSKSTLKVSTIRGEFLRALSTLQTARIPSSTTDLAARDLNVTLIRIGMQILHLVHY